MFNKCNSLISLLDISKWNTSNVIDRQTIFNKDDSLISDLSKWDTSYINNKKSWFKKYQYLKSLPDISKWDSSDKKFNGNINILNIYP